MQALLNKLLDYWHPTLERCGFITGNNQILEKDNLHQDPKNHFALEDIPEGAVALWHTHPSGCCNLSMDDYKLFKSLPSLIHVIVGQQEVAYYYVDEDGEVIRGEDNAC